jgi:hypothetical protein
MGNVQNNTHVYLIFLHSFFNHKRHNHALQVALNMTCTDFWTHKRQAGNVFLR